MIGIIKILLISLVFMSIIITTSKSLLLVGLVSEILWITTFSTISVINISCNNLFLNYIIPFLILITAATECCIYWTLLITNFLKK